MIQVNESESPNSHISRRTSGSAAHEAEHAGSVK